DVGRQGLRTRGPGISLEGREDNLVVFDPDVTVLPGEQALDLRHGAVQLGFARFQACQPLAGRPRLADDLRPPAGPLRRGNKIRVWIGVAATVGDPDIAR